MADKFPFTDKRISKLKAPAIGRKWWYDTKVQGLAVCRTAAGSDPIFYVYRWTNGKPVRVRIDTFPRISVDDARTVAAQHNAQIAAGIDPQERKQKARRTLTVGQAFEYFLEHQAKPFKRSWRVDQQRFERHLKPWKGRTLASVTKADVQSLHVQVGECNGHYEANRLRSLLHSIFALASHDLDFTGPNPVAGVKKWKEHSRERFLHADELPRFFAALDAERLVSPVVCDCIEMSLWSGARRSCVLSMKWQEVNLERGTWTIPASKMKADRAIVVPLPEPAISLLHRRLAACDDTPYVFPGHIRGRHLVSPEKVWKAICEKAGLADLRLHDLRRTMGSWQAATGASLSVIGKSLGHQHHGTTAIYARLDLSPVRQAVEKATSAMLAAGKQKTEVERN